MKRFEKHYKAIVVGLLIVIAIPVLTIFWFWFWDRYLPELDAVNAGLWNNLLTPILTLLTTALLVYVALNQNRLLHSQNEYILSQNIKPFYEKQLDDVVEIFKTFEINHGNSLDPSLRVKKVNPNNVASIVTLVLSDLVSKESFQEDYQDYRNGIERKRSYYLDREYAGSLFFLWQFAIAGIPVYHRVETLLADIAGSKLHQEDKLIFYRRIKSELVLDYLQLFSKSFPLTGTLVPRLFGQNRNQPTEYVEFMQTKFRMHYDVFKRYLE